MQSRPSKRTAMETSYNEKLQEVARTLRLTTVLLLEMIPQEHA